MSCTGLLNWGQSLSSWIRWVQERRNFIAIHWDYVFLALTNRTAGVFFGVRLNKPLNKQCSCWWVETLWHSYDVTVMWHQCLPTPPINISTVARRKVYGLASITIFFVRSEANSDKTIVIHANPHIDLFLSRYFMSWTQNSVKTFIDHSFRHCRQRRYFLT